MGFFTKVVTSSSHIDGLLELELNPFYDDRGSVCTLYSDVLYLPNFVEDKITKSSKGVLRGLHGDRDIGKLIVCLEGNIQLAVADLRENSYTRNAHCLYNLDGNSLMAIYVPPGCVNGHLCLSENCMFYYKWTHYYNGPGSQVTVRWDDIDLNIKWATKDPILSERDQKGLNSKEIYL